MNFEVETWYGGHLIDFVKFAAVYGAYGERIEKPADIKPSLQRAINSGRPAIVEIIVDRETDASMETALDKVIEYEPLPLKITVG